MVGLENYVDNGLCDSTLPTGFDGHNSAERTTAIIKDNYLQLICTKVEDPFFQLFDTDKINLISGLLNPRINAGDTLTVAFDYQRKEGVSAIFGWFAYTGSWEETYLALPVANSFIRHKITFTIPENATGFMLRFKVRTLNENFNIKNIALTKGSISAYHFPSINDIKNKFKS